MNEKYALSVSHEDIHGTKRLIFDFDAHKNISIDVNSKGITESK